MMMMYMTTMMITYDYVFYVYQEEEDAILYMRQDWILIVTRDATKNENGSMSFWNHNFVCVLCTMYSWSFQVVVAALMLSERMMTMRCIPWDSKFSLFFMLISIMWWLRFYIFYYSTHLRIFDSIHTTDLCTCICGIWFYWMVF